MIKLMLPSAHPSPQPKRQIDCVQSFLHSPYTLQWATLSPKLPLLMGDLDHI